MNIDFYLEYLRFNEENIIERDNHFKNLIEYLLKSYNVNLAPDVEYNNDRNILGGFDSYENKLKVFNTDFLIKELTSYLYLNNENSLENVLKYVNADKNVKDLIYQNEDIFKTYLYKIKNIDTYKKLTEKFKKDELKYNFGLENKLNKIIKENTIIQKVKNIFKSKDEINKNDEK